MSKLTCATVGQPDRKPSGRQGGKPTADGPSSSLRSSEAARPRERRCLLCQAFTLVEMLTTVAVLIIVLGLMVSLARDVRRRSAEQLTRSLLQRLEAVLGQYQNHNAGQLPPVEPLFAGSAIPDLAGLDEAARRNNRQLVAILKQDVRQRVTDVDTGIDPFQDLPISVYDHYSIRDAWGWPIVFMPGQHPLIGMAPSKKGQDQAFFFSAGPDRNYLTRDDNLYSYELPAAGGG